MDNTNAHYKMPALAITLAALLIAGTFVALPLATNASAQTSVSITTSADPHNNKFFGPAILEVRIQDPALAADNTGSVDVPVSITAFGSTQSVLVDETGGTSGTLLMYIKADANRNTVEAPAVPGTPLSTEYVNVIIGAGATNPGYDPDPNVDDDLFGLDAAVQEGGTIQISYGGVTKTITYDDTPATITLDRSNYGPGASLYATVYDPDINLDPTRSNTLTENTLQLLTGDDSIAADAFTETGTNTARFEATETVRAIASGTSVSRSLTANDFKNFNATGTSVDVDITPGSTAQGTASASYVVQIVNGAFQSIPTLTYSGELPIVVVDSDRNLNSKAQETFNNDLPMLINGSTTATKFNLRERNLNSNELVPAYGQDRIKVTFKEESSNTNGILRLRPGEEVDVLYDDANPDTNTTQITLEISNTAPTLASDKTTAGKSSEVKLTMTDPELNDDSSIVESYTVSYTDTTDADATVSFGSVPVFSLVIERNGAVLDLDDNFAVTFIETRANTGVFEATIDLADLDTASPDSLSDGDSLNFEVTDLLEAGEDPSADVTVNIGIDKPTLDVDRSTVPVPRVANVDDDAAGTTEDDVSNAGPVSVIVTITDPARNNSTITQETLQATTADLGKADGIFKFDGGRLVITLTPAPGTTFDAPTHLQIVDAIKETGFNTGVFQGEVQVIATDNDLPKWIGAKMKIEYKGLSLSDSSDDANSVTVTFTARNAVLSTDTSVVVNGGDMTVTVSDQDANRDPGTDESVKVRVQWTNADGLSNDQWLTLDETGNNTGVFTETVTVGDDTIGTETFSVSPDEDVELTYYDATPSVSATQSAWPTLGDSTGKHKRTLSVQSASGSLDIDIGSQVGPSAKIDVTVFDTDENTDPNTKQTVNNLITVATDRGVSVELDIKETDGNSARFVGTINLVPDPTPEGDGTGTASGTEVEVQVLPGDVVSVRYEDQNDENGRRSTVSKQFTVVSVDPDIKTDKAAYAAGDQVKITVADLDADEDPDSNDIKTVKVTSTSDLVGLGSVQLIEIDANTGVFEGTLTLTTEFSSGSLMVRNGDIITIKYTDKFPADYKDRVDAGGTTSKDFTINVPVGTSGSQDTTTPSAPALRDAQGNAVTQVLAGQQVVLSSTIQNNEAASTPYAAIVEVRDSNGITVFLNWQTGTLAADGETGIGLSWTPDQPGTYTARVYVLSGLTNPQILSDTVTSTITVN